MRMLDIYHAIAKRIAALRMLFWVLAAGACVAFGVGLFRTPGTNYFLGALVVLLWSLLMIALTQSFVHPAPVADPSAPWLRRMKVKCWRAYLHALAAATTLLCAFVVFLSIRALSLLLRN